MTINQEIKILFDNGHSIKAIMETVQVSYERVMNVLQKLDVVVRRKAQVEVHYCTYGFMEVTERPTHSAIDDLGGVLDSILTGSNMPLIRETIVTPIEQIVEKFLSSGLYNTVEAHPELGVVVTFSEKGLERFATYKCIPFNFYDVTRGMAVIRIIGLSKEEQIITSKGVRHLLIPTNF